jgi:RNA polymerase sigma factor (sigma-70 family)
MQPTPAQTPVMDIDDKVLLKQVLDHEQGAFEAFLERYRSLVFSVLYGKGFGFPRDYMEDIYQSFVLALTHRDYHRLRSYEGRNNCSVATFLQIVTTRFALDELRKWKRHPRGRGNVSTDDDEMELEIEDPRDTGPVSENLKQEELDIFHNLLFSLDWKRVSVVLWVFRAVTRERVAEVMDTSRANIDALYKRAKDQMTQRFADGAYSTDHRESDPEVLTASVRDLMRRLLTVPSPALREALLQPGCKHRALVGMVLVENAHFRCTASEISRLSGDQPVPEICESVLQELADRVLP